MTGAISVIIPTLDEAGEIVSCLAALAPWRALGHEVIVADGGSRDDTRALAAPLADRVLVVPRGRARQMNAGAAVARGAVLLFLHADARLPANAEGTLRAALADPARQWGRFDVCLVPGSVLLAVVGWAMNWRSRLSGIATGDQAMFVRRESFVRAGGFPEIALMEDVALSARLKRAARPVCLRSRVRVSDRRWRRGGTLATVALMWRLRLAYFLGADPTDLARRYSQPR